MCGPSAAGKKNVRPKCKLEKNVRPKCNRKKNVRPKCKSTFKRNVQLGQVSQKSVKKRGSFSGGQECPKMAKNGTQKMKNRQIQIDEWD